MGVGALCPEKITGVSSVDSKVQRTTWDWHLNRSANDVRNQVRRANRALEGLDIRAKFSIHEGTGEIMIKLEDTQTGEVLREIPPEKLLDLLAKMREVTQGIVNE